MDHRNQLGLMRTNRVSDLLGVEYRTPLSFYVNQITTGPPCDLGQQVSKTAKYRYQHFVPGRDQRSKTSLDP